MERSPKERGTVFAESSTTKPTLNLGNYRAAVEPLLKLTPAAAAKTDESAYEKDSNKKNKKP